MNRKREKPYHLFQVYNDTGGELSCDVNNTKDCIVSDLYELLNIEDFIENSEENNSTIRELCNSEEFIKKVNDQIHLYAGGDDGVTFELYVCEDNILISIDWSIFTDELAELYLKYLEDE